MNLNRISNYNNLLDLNIEKSSSNVEKGDKFLGLLDNAINKVNQLQVENEEYNAKLAVGELDNLHDLTIASEKANISLQLTMGIRNKVIEAYKEIMRIQI